MQCDALGESGPCNRKPLPFATAVRREGKNEAKTACLCRQHASMPRVLLAPDGKAWIPARTASYRGRP